MMLRILCLLFAVISTGAAAKNLCLPSEETVFSFETKSKKILSVCKAANESYLTYKFGTLKKIELQIPDKLDKASWQKFEFSGMSRGGGKMNAGFGDYSLSFECNDTEFTIFQQWNYEEENSYSIGVTIAGTGKPITIKGLKKTQEGSLVLLEREEKNIRNVSK
jgi:hypothetical protein